MFLGNRECAREEGSGSVINLNILLQEANTHTYIYIIKYSIDYTQSRNSTHRVQIFYKQRPMVVDKVHDFRKYFAPIVVPQSRLRQGKRREGCSQQAGQLKSLSREIVFCFACDIASGRISDDPSHRQTRRRSSIVAASGKDRIWSGSS